MFESRFQSQPTMTSVLQAMERDSPKTGLSVLVAHSTSSKDEKDKKKPKSQFGSHLPTFGSWTGFFGAAA